MKELLEKIASYNLFNFLLPGVLFAILANWITDYKLPLDNLIIGAFICYFLGLIISRVGSLFVEPILKKTSFVKFADYKDYVSASIKDPLIITLSEANNMYRTFIAMILILITVKAYEILEKRFSILEPVTPYLLIISLLILFLWSYKKQTNYIKARVNNSK